MDDQLNTVLTGLATRDAVPVATKVTDLLKVALELEEDTALLGVVSDRRAKKAKFLPHHKVWKLNTR